MWITANLKTSHCSTNPTISKMKNKIILGIIITLIVYFILITVNNLISYFDDQPPSFDETQQYVILKDKNSCLLRLENVSTGKSNWIAGTSHKTTRTYLNKRVMVKGEYIYTKKYRTTSIPLLGIDDTCKSAHNPPYMLTVQINSVTEINKN